MLHRIQTTLIERFLRHRNYVRACRDLHRLSDRELRDIGIDRGNIENAVRGGRLA